MRLPPFDHSKMQWDAWEAFHIDHKYHAFIQFDTGEFVVCYSSWRPEHRHVYRDLNIQIVATDDDLCPRLYIPGQDKPILKSHLNHKGMQTLLLDFDHKRAVGLYPWLTEATAPLVPQRFTKGNHNVTAYYPGPDAPPVGAPVTRHYPQPLTMTQRKHINELVDASKVWLEMQSDQRQAQLEHEHRNVTAPVFAFTESPFSMLTEAYRTAIAMSGFNMIIREEHPWLTFNVKGETHDDES